MLTIFTIPKAFEGHIGIIQENAITSWTRLMPACEVVLCGDDKGTPEIAAKLKVKHLPDIARNQYGTPLVSAAFEQAQQAANYDLMCYVNADIIILKNFLEAVSRVNFDRFLIVGERFDLDLTTPWNFADEDWEKKMGAYVSRNGVNHPPLGSDYFVFRKGDAIGQLPEFAVGRPGWDNWLIYHARELGLPVIDVSGAAKVIHQNHDYRHVAAQSDDGWEGPEAVGNRQLAGGWDQLFTLLDATHLMTADELVPASKRPVVSIGLPVYNGGEHLKKALDSLLAQNFENFELIVSDNASTDSTEQICLEYASKDARIRYLRNQTNIGAAKNFQRTLDLARGKYFLPAAHDDLWAPSFLRRCLEVLATDNAKLFCCTSLRFIDEEDQVIETDYDAYDNPDLSSLDVRYRIGTLMTRSGWYATYSLFRTELLRTVGVVSEAYAGDVRALIELSLMGPAAKVPEVLFSYRQFQSRTEEDRANCVKPGLKADYQHLLRMLARTVLKSKLRPVMKLLILKDMVSVVYDADSVWRHRLPPSRLVSIIRVLKRLKRGGK
jgi:glycosyltransferase involved in cell wall biosynthesis